MTRRSPAAWCTLLAWCVVCGWFAFVRGARVPLVSMADLGFHELGHLVMYVVPIHPVLTAAMGSVAQCAVPLGLAAYFWFRRHDGPAAGACVAWASTNFRDASVYIADAPTQRLELLGGEHDWAFILGPEHLDRLDAAHSIAVAVRGTGAVLLCATILLAARALVTARSAASIPVAATAARPDDRLPSR